MVTPHHIRIHVHSVRCPSLCKLCRALPGLVVPPPMADALSNTKLLRAALAKGVVSESRATGSTSFAKPYYQTDGYLHVEVQGEQFWLHDDIKDAAILEEGSTDPSGLDLGLEDDDEASLQADWIENVRPLLRKYMALRGKPVKFLTKPRVVIRPTKEGGTTTFVKPDIG